MRARIFVATAVVAVITGIVGILVLAKPIKAASPPVPHAHVLVHFDLANLQQPENITLEPDGSADLTFAFARQVVRVNPDGQLHVWATGPAPPAGSSTPLLGSPFLGGIVRAHDGTLYFNYSTGSADLTGIWRLRPHGSPTRIAALP